MILGVRRGPPEKIWAFLGGGGAKPPEKNYTVFSLFNEKGGGQGHVTSSQDLTVNDLSYAG